MSKIYGVKGPGWKETKLALEEEGHDVIVTELGNMKHIGVEICGVHFTSAEGAYQSTKFTDFGIVQELASQGGIKAKSFAYSHKDKMVDRGDGELTRAMMIVLAVKKLQNPEWAKALSKTLDGEIHELSNNKWGITGEDLLGKVLDAVRTHNHVQLAAYLDGKDLSITFPWVQQRHESKNVDIVDHPPVEEVNPNMKKAIAIIGSRLAHVDKHGKVVDGISSADFDLLVRTAFWLVTNDRIVVTGGAEGADHAAMLGAALGAQAAGVDLKDVLKVFLPWATYNKEIVPLGADIIVGGFVAEDMTLARLHPNFERLTQGVQRMMLRNAQIIRNAASVVAAPRVDNGVIVGGTAHGVNCANKIKRPLILLSDVEQRAGLVRKIAG
jgi:predicted NAD-dependent protein-ADP-ribosyltransferase YbiA (DUF1768 family)